ncbi:mechanosensitive ion channel [Erythrobacteraceae bacterium E2-1 Yellow Sea]|nr:mechanosensitive ion channel [Erythrobacteraceae bacterium E2-1 Yellow Sea]
MPIDLAGVQPAIDRVVATLILWGPRLLAALAILIVTHFVAKLIQRGITRIGTRAAWQKANVKQETSAEIWKQAGKLGYWVVWLFGFLTALQPLELGQVVAPLNSLLNEVGAFLPNLIGALAIFIVGFALSKIARGITENAIGVLQIERLLTQDEAKLAERTKARASLAMAAGVAVQILVLLPIALAAIDVLGITAVTVPLRELLATVLLAVPHVIAAALVLVIAFFIGRWVAGMAESFLSGLGVDQAGEAIGLSGDKFSLSRVSYHLILIAIMLFAVTEAARLLNFAMVSQIADEVVRLGGRIAFGAAFIAATFVIARIVTKLLSESGATRAATPAGYVVIGLGAAMGLSFMGIATQIVTIAFAVTLGAVAIAGAIAFGVGGRETAHELLQDWKKSNNGKV